jgi:hypothetical protein
MHSRAQHESLPSSLCPRSHPQVPVATTVPAYIITHTLNTNRIETLTSRLVNHEDGRFVVAADRTVRIARGHA